jgi:hypothetical protein
MVENVREAMVGSDGEHLSINGIAAYQPSDGLMELKVVKFRVFVTFFFLMMIVTI